MSPSFARPSCLLGTRMRSCRSRAGATYALPYFCRLSFSFCAAWRPPCMASLRGICIPGSGVFAVLRRVAGWAALQTTYHASTNHECDVGLKALRRKKRSHALISLLQLVSFRIFAAFRSRSLSAGSGKARCLS
ncbi:unnamed protein product [Scytosiphon promiscuus]